MPWKTESVMEQRLKFVIEASQRSESFSQLSRDYGISRQTGYKWLKRYQQAGQLTDFTSTEPHISPDGTLIACIFTDEKNINHVGVVPFEGGALLMTFDIPQTVNIDATAKWTPDGRAITYIDSHGGASNLWQQPLVGRPPKQLTDFKQNGIHRREWTRDGKQVAIVRGEGTYDVVMITDFR